jgi:hypothetical protein
MCMLLGRNLKSIRISAAPDAKCCRLVVGSPTQHWPPQCFNNLTLPPLRLRRLRQTLRPQKQIQEDKRDGLDRAKEDAEKLDSSKRRLAICFVTPAISEKEFRRHEYDCDFLDQTIASLKNKTDAIFWIGFKEWKAGKVPDDNTFYPGLLLLIKEV